MKDETGKLRKDALDELAAEEKAGEAQQAEAAAEHAADNLEAVQEEQRKIVKAHAAEEADAQSAVDEAAHEHDEARKAAGEHKDA